MLVGNTEIGREQMPSYISPSQQPYHLYQSMQDVLQQSLQNRIMMMAPSGPGAVNKSNQWSNDNNGNQKQ